MVMVIWLIYGITLITMELFYHFGCYGLKGISPLLPLALISVIASIQTLIVCSFKKKQQKILFWCFLVADYILFLVQTVYYTVFRQPLQVRAALVGGQDALTNYYREAGMGILKALPILALLALPLVVSYVLIRKKKVSFKNTNSLQKIRIGFGFGVSLLLFYVVFGVGKYIKAEYYEVYSEFYAPDMVAEKMGVITLAQRDLFFEIESLFGGGSGAGIAEDAELPAITTPMPGLVFTPTPTPAADNPTKRHDQTK